MPTDRLNAAGSAGRAPDDEARRSRDTGHAQLAAGRVTEAGALLAYACTPEPDFAPTFDEHLRAPGYEVPGRPETLLDDCISAPLDIPDLVCGTGLSGIAFAPRQRCRVGVDLSGRMLAPACARALDHYDELHEAEVGAWLGDCRGGEFDPTVAADILNCVGTLDANFFVAARVLRQGGWFAFSIEACMDADFRVRTTGGYAQNPACVARLAAPASATAATQPATIRTEGGSPIPGSLDLLRRESA